MKKLIATVLVLAVLAGCAGGNPPGAGEDGVITIDERFFVTQVYQILADRQLYLGQTIRYEGIFRSAQMGGQEFFFVFRHTHGCCGPDGVIGFEVLLGDIQPPPTDAWVEVVGVLEEIEAFYQTLLVLNATSLTELAERGREFVE